MSQRRRLLILLVVLLAPRAAGGVEIPLPGTNRTIRLGVSQSLITEYRSDIDEVPDKDDDPSNESFGEFKNKTDVVLMHGTTSFNLRFDFDAFVGGYDTSYRQATMSLEKISLSSIQKSFEITAGDFYVRVGRGLALDLTRVDDMFRDTTLRGGMLKVHTQWVDGQVFGGWVNPLDADGFSGIPVWVPSDVIGGGRVEIRPTPAVALGVHYIGAGIESQMAKARNATHIVGGSVELPSLWQGALSVYGEYNLINRVGDQFVESGSGAYVGVTANWGGLAVLAEFKYHRRFELSNPANKTGGWKVPPERWDHAWKGGVFSPPLLIYHRPPTLMWKKQEVLNNHDVIGPRLRLDYRIAGWGSTLWASYGRFFRSDGAVDVGFFDSGITVNDVFGGLQQQLSAGALELTAGYRADKLDQGGTDFRHIFAEGELATRVYKHHSIDVEVQYRRVLKTAKEYSKFLVAASYRPSKYFAGGASYEWTDEFDKRAPGAGARKHFGGVTATANITPSTFARAFIGSTAGGLRCMDGSCREIPSFIGARLTLVAQF